MLVDSILRSKISYFLQATWGCGHWQIKMTLIKEAAELNFSEQYKEF